MGKHAGLIVSANINEFFRSEVVQACTDLGVQMAPPVEYYLVQLLCDFSRMASDRQPTREPLALMYKKAVEAHDGAQLAEYKHLGDVALYVAGFFTDSIERSLVDVDYYIGMGGSAYSSVAKLVAAQRRGQASAQVYSELSSRFTDHVDVLNQISERAQKHEGGDAGLLKLYDRYVRTGSARIRKQLLERGLLPTDCVPTDYVQ